MLVHSNGSITQPLFFACAVLCARCHRKKTLRMRRQTLSVEMCCHVTRGRHTREPHDPAGEGSRVSLSREVLLSDLLEGHGQDIQGDPSSKCP